MNQCTGESMNQLFIAFGGGGDGLAGRPGVDGELGRKLVGNVEKAAAVGTEDQLVARMKAVINVGHEGHVAGVADVFLAATVGFAQGGEGFAFEALGQTLKSVA